MVFEDDDQNPYESIVVFDDGDQNLFDLFSHPTKDGGLGIPCLRRDSAFQFEASKSITKTHVDSIFEQSDQMKVPEQPLQATKNEVEKRKDEKNKELIEEVDSKLSPDVLRQVEQARDKGASSWLNAIPYEEHGFCLNKQEFRDSIRLRYNMRLKDLPVRCGCRNEELFSIEHALSCKTGGFIAQRHDNIKNLLVGSLAKVCKNVESEPRLIPLDNETFRLRSTNTSDEARLDLKAGSFWSNGVTAFFDVRVTHVNSQTNQGLTTEKIFEKHENEKKRLYNQRILDVEHGTFTPLVFGTNGGMGEECSLFLKKLAEKLSYKTDESYANIVTWLRTKISFSILKSVNMCIRGSRRPFKSTQEREEVGDFRFNATIAGL